jgi:ABC-type amino acid transport substrate-binding protein
MRLSHLAVCIVVICSSSVVVAQTTTATNASAPANQPLPPEDGQWTMPAKNYQHTRFSGRDQISASNVRNLRVAWTVTTGVDRGQEVAPIVVGDTMYVAGDPASKLIDAVADGEIDAAVAWGPPAGFFARRHELGVAPVTPQVDESLLMAFEVSMSVAKKNKPLRDQLNTILRARHAGILDAYHIPRVPAAKPGRFNPDKEVPTADDEVPGCCQ